MSLFGWLMCQSDTKKSPMTLFWNIIWLAILALAIFLAIKDMGMLTHTSTKIWVLLLAIAWPEGFVILQGISTSVQGIGFFSGSPIEPRSFMKHAASSKLSAKDLGLDSADLSDSSSLF